MIKEKNMVYQAEKALRSAVRKLRKERARTGKPMLIWRDGKVVKLYVKKSKKL